MSLVPSVLFVFSCVRHLTSCRDAELEKEASRAAEASRVEVQRWKEKAEASQVEVRRQEEKAKGESRRPRAPVWLVFFDA